MAPTPSRIVYQADAIPWLRAQGKLAGASVITSLPDISELPHLGFAGWRRWFEDAAVLVMESLAEPGVAIFFQSDIQRGGRWIDKGALVARAAERVGMDLLFHKIVCREPPGTASFGRATYAHMLAFSRGPARGRKEARVDVLPDGGFKPGPKAMGVKACLDACRFVKSATSSRTVVDPFCGLGTVLAVANALGLDAVGVDIASRMCRRARELRINLDA